MTINPQEEMNQIIAECLGDYERASTLHVLIFRKRIL